MIHLKICFLHFFLFMFFEMFQMYPSISGTTMERLIGMKPNLILAMRHYANPLAWQVRSRELPHEMSIVFQQHCDTQHWWEATPNTLAWLVGYWMSQYVKERIDD